MIMEGNSVDKRRHTLSSVLVDPAILRVIKGSGDSQDIPDEQMMNPLDQLWSRQHVDVIEKRLLLLEQSKERFEYRLCELESLKPTSQQQQQQQHFYEDSETLDNSEEDEEEEEEEEESMSLPPMKPEERQPSRDVMHNDSEGAYDELKRLKKQYSALVLQFELKEKENRDYQSKYNDSLKKCKSIQQAYDKDRLKFKEKEMHWEQHVRNLETELLLYHPIKLEKRKHNNNNNNKNGFGNNNNPHQKQQQQQQQQQQPYKQEQSQKQQQKRYGQQLSKPLSLKPYQQPMLHYQHTQPPSKIQHQQQYPKQQQQQTQMHTKEEEEEEEEVEELAVLDDMLSKKEEASTFKEEDGYLIFNTTNANGELIHCRVKIPSSTATSVRSSSPVRRPADFPWALVSPPTTRAGSPRPPFEPNSTKKGLNPNAPEWNGNWKISPPHSTV